MALNSYSTHESGMVLEEINYRDLASRTAKESFAGNQLTLAYTHTLSHTHLLELKHRC